MTLKHILLAAVAIAALLLVLPLVVSAAPLDQPAIPHTLEGRSACTSCHTVGGPGVGAPGGTGLPTSHQGRTDAVCTGCHQAASAAPKPAAPTATAAPKPAAPTPTAAAKPAAPTPTAAAKPAAPTPTPAAGALPRTGDSPSPALILLGAATLLLAGWGIRRIVLAR